MAKIMKTNRVYLTIEVEEPWKPKPAQWAGLGYTKADELKRLLKAANIDYLDHIDWHVEIGPVCSICGYDWEVDEDGCPMCCDAAQKEWEAANVEP